MIHEGMLSLAHEGEQTYLGRKVRERRVVAISTMNEYCESGFKTRVSTSSYRSRINKIRSFANRFRLDKQEKPKSASVKKNTPKRFWNPAMSFVMFWKKNPQITAHPACQQPLPKETNRQRKDVRATVIDEM